MHQRDLFQLERKREEALSTFTKESHELSYLTVMQKNDLKAGNSTVLRTKGCPESKSTGK